MRVTEARPSRDPVVEGRGGPVGVTTGQVTDYNVLHVVLDDVGVEWFTQYREYYGDRWVEASSGAVKDDYLPSLPWFEEMADAGLLFFDAVTAPICGPHRTGSLSGRWGFRHGHNTNIRDPGSAVPAIGNYKVPLSEQFLPAYIKSKRPDYHTGCFAKWHMADQYAAATPGDSYGCPTLAPSVNLTHPNLMGFDHADNHPANIGGAYTWWRVINGVVQAQITGDAPRVYDETTYPTAVFGAAALAWITSKGNDPWYCYVAFGPPHSQFRCPPFSMLPAATQTALTNAGIVAGDEATGSVRTNATLALIAPASMQATDEALRRIWDGLTPEVQGRTIVIITGDNGTTSELSPLGFNHFKRQIYWGGTRVPFAIRAPMVANPGERVRSIISSVDIFDTVTDLLGLARATGNTRDSVSMLPLIHNTVDRQAPNSLRDYVYTSLGTNQLMDGLNEQWAVYDGRYRTGLMAGLSSVITTDEAEDPFETADVSVDVPEVTAAATAWKVALVGS